MGLFHDWYIGPFPEMMKEYSTGGLYVWNPQTGNIPYSVDWVIRIVSMPFSFLEERYTAKHSLYSLLPSVALRLSTWEEPLDSIPSSAHRWNSIHFFPCYLYEDNCWIYILPYWICPRSGYLVYISKRIQ